MFDKLRKAFAREGVQEAPTSSAAPSTDLERRLWAQVGALPGAAPGRPGRADRLGELVSPIEDELSPVRLLHGPLVHHRLPSSSKREADE